MGDEQRLLHDDRGSDRRDPRQVGLLEHPSGLGLRGLLSLAFHPRYVVNGRAYVYYVGRDGATYVAEIRTVRGFAASRRVLLRIPASRAPYAHYGGHVLFGPDGLLYVSIGDGGVPATAQDPDVLLGKIVRLRVGGRTQNRRSLPVVCATRGGSRSRGMDRRS